MQRLTSYKRSKHLRPSKAIEDLWLDAPPRTWRVTDDATSHHELDNVRIPPQANPNVESVVDRPRAKLGVAAAKVGDLRSTTAELGHVVARANQRASNIG